MSSSRVEVGEETLAQMFATLTLHLDERRKRLRRARHGL